jgi:uncharacterized membrane protein
VPDDPVFLYLGVYDDPREARDDLDIVRQLHATHIIGTYDAAVTTKDEKGDVHVEKHEKPTQHGAWWGLGAGAVVGILFPPALLGALAVGGLTGGLIGHFTRGMSRKDVHELGELLDEGQACLIVIGKDKLSGELEKAGIKARRHSERRLAVDRAELEKELEAARADSGQTSISE